MGLDISAYRQLKAAPEAQMEDGQPVEWDRYLAISPETLAYTEKNFPGRVTPLVAGVFSFADEIRFRAGSYRGFNAWRDWLATAAGYPSAKAVWEGYTEGPFFELINFSDCEGIIGPVIAAKLAKDFAEHQDKITPTAVGWEAKLYHTWREAFEMAADGGCVEFH